LKYIGNLFIIIGVVCLGVFGYQFVKTEMLQNNALAEAEEQIEQAQVSAEDSPMTLEEFEVDTGGAAGTLEIPKLGKTLPIVEGTDPDDLDKGVGHLKSSVWPGQDEQILLSGHRDTVFRDFDQIEIGDEFVVNMPYGEYTYEIKETEIVPEDDTSVIGEMGEEVLVVTTCYPFHFVGAAPDRFVAYAYPVE
jgi:sortase A